MLLVLVIISIEHNTNVIDRQVYYDTSENTLILTAQVNVNQENRCLHFMSNLWSIVRIRLMGNSKPLGRGGKPASYYSYNLSPKGGVLFYLHLHTGSLDSVVLLRSVRLSLLAYLT